MKNTKKLIMGMVISLAVIGATLTAPKITKAALTTNNLGDLFIIGGLFKNDTSGILNTGSGSGLDLGNLIILDQLFGNGNSRATGRANLGNLLILNQLFNNTGLFGANTGTNNLSRLFILDRLFSNNGGGIFSSSVLGGATSQPRTTAPPRVTEPTTPTSTPSTPTTTSTPVTSTTSTAPTIPTPTTTPSATSTTSTPAVGTPTGETVVTITSFGYVPQEVTINAGETVRWISRDLAAHTITSDSALFDSPILNTSESFRMTFTAHGTYRYFSKPDPSIAGTVIVK